MPAGGILPGRRAGQAGVWSDHVLKRGGRLRPGRVSTAAGLPTCCAQIRLAPIFDPRTIIPCKKIADAGIGAHPCRAEGMSLERARALDQRLSRQICSTRRSVAAVAKAEGSTMMRYATKMALAAIVIAGGLMQAGAQETI